MQKITPFFLKFPGLLALAAGALSATGFAPLNMWPITLACLVLLIVLVARAPGGWQAARTGWLFGLGHFSIGNGWIAVAFTFQAAMPIWLGYIAVVALAMYLAVYPALCAWSAWWIASRNGRVPGFVGLRYVLAFAGCWTITEWLRSWVFTGYSWNPLSMAMLYNYGSPPLIRWIGTYGASGLYLLTAGLYVWSWYHLANRANLRRRVGMPVLIAIWLVLVALWNVTLLVGDRLTVTDNVAKKTVNLTIVQPNISQADKYAAGYDAINFAKLAMNSRQLPSQGPRLVLWPEAAIPDYLEDGYPLRFYQFQPGESARGARQRLTALMDAGDILVTGANRLVIEDGQLVAARNSVSAMNSNGLLLGHYDKAHLVPYGEYLPMPWLLRPLGLARLVPGELDFWPGPGARTLDVEIVGKPVKIGLQICYEMIFSGQVVDRRNRPDFIFNPSNDAWFGTVGPPQHLAQARLRAVEEGLPVVRATPTGISAVINADGKILKSLALGTSGRIDTILPVAKTPTLFARYGNILAVGFGFLLIAFALLPLARRHSSR
ncbi:MAG: apolipoprotein N-acyltransferase [Sphingorhabdus sp.]